MPQKLTIEQVKQFVKDNTRDECKILDDEYINSKAKLSVRCKCGNVFQRDFDHIKRGQFYCPECKKRLFSEMYRSEIGQVIEEIHKSGCEYISGEYKNNNSILTIRCRCGETFTKSMAKFKNGQNRCPKCGKESLRKSKRKYDSEFVKKAIKQSGYSIIGEYVDAYTPTKCICSKGHVFDLIFGEYIAGHSGCKQCANDMLKRENCWCYKGGITKVSFGIRESLETWKKNIKEAYGNVCAITGERPKRLDIHHLYSFSDIVKKCCDEMGVELKDKVRDYENYETYDTLRQIIVKKHDVNTGIPISHSIHMKFHSKYGRENNTPEQFDEFLKENYGISLNDIMKKAKE